MKLCGAKTKGTGEPCKKPALPSGRCRLHGGLSTGPKGEPFKAFGNEYGLKHGAYAKLYADRLKPEEKTLYEQASDEANVDEEIKLLRVKLARILEREGIDEDDRDRGIVIVMDQLRKLIETKKKVSGEDEAEDDPLKELARVIAESKARRDG